MLLLLLLVFHGLLSFSAKVKANQVVQSPPPSFQAVVPTSIMGDFEGALFPFVMESEATTTTTTTTPAPFGTDKVDVEAAWVLVGGRAALVCHASSPENPQEQLATVLWYRGTKGEPIFTYDAREAVSNATAWSEDSPRGFGARATFDPHHATMFIENIQAHENGLYRCRVDFKRSQTINTLVNLTVVVPPDPPQILDTSGRRLGSLIGPYDEGEPLAIICMSSKKGYPLPDLVWQENEPEASIVDSMFEKTHQEAQNKLHINALTRSHFGKTLTCFASNNNVTRPAATNVTIDMRLLPQTVTISTPPEPFSVSRPAILECRSSGSRPPATITWWKRGKFMGKATEEFLRDGMETYTLSRITFHPKPNDHEKDVICRAENTNIQSSAIEASYTLTIHYPPKARLSLGTSIDPDAISEGNDVYMDCEIRANPRAYKVEWSHNGLRVEQDPSSGVRILAGGKNLVLQGIQRHHGGNYSCTAFNLEGEDTSNPVAISVMFKPECVHDGPVTLGVVPKRDAEVLCGVRGLPVPTNFRWTFNNSYEANEVPSNKFSFNGSVSRLNYRAESEKDFGVVQCWAENRLGMTQKPCIFTLIPAGPPDPPQNCDVHNHTTQGLSVTCSRGFGGGLEQTFHMEVRDRDTGHLLQNMSNHDPIFTVGEFKTSKGVSLGIYSSNSHGRSISQVHLETAPSKVAELQVETSSKASQGSPHFLIGIMVGLLSTLVILALLIVVLIKVHAKRQPPTGTFDTTATTTSAVVAAPTSSSSMGNSQQLTSGSQRLNNAGRKGPFHTSSSSPGSDDPDLIPLQKIRLASNDDSRLFNQTGLEDRPPPPSLHQHRQYNYYSRPPEPLDSQVIQDASDDHLDVRPMAATIRMGPNMLAINPTWPSRRSDDDPEDKKFVQLSTSSSGLMGVSATMVASSSSTTSSSGASGWPARLV